jgi:hypothetical protein
MAKKKYLNENSPYLKIAASGVLFVIFLSVEIFYIAQWREYTNHQTQLNHEGLTTEGQVTSVRITSGGRKTHHPPAYYPTIEFVDFNGIAHESEIRCFYAIKKGERVSLTYVRSNPKIFRIDNDKNTIYTWPVFGVITLCFVFATFIFVCAICSVAKRYAQYRNLKRKRRSQTKHEISGYCGGEKK